MGHAGQQPHGKVFQLVQQELGHCDGQHVVHGWDDQLVQQVREECGAQQLAQLHECWLGSTQLVQPHQGLVGKNQQLAQLPCLVQQLGQLLFHELQLVVQAVFHGMDHGDDDVEKAELVLVLHVV